MPTEPINEEHVSRWAKIFDLQMTEAIANAKEIDVDRLLKILHSTSQIYRGISERSTMLVAQIQQERADNARTTDSTNG